MGDVILLVDDLKPAYPFCRICHEEEFESCKNLEAPCACSGTVKFAHRDCIQRWCDEKGNTACEICLQKFEPGYTASPKEADQINTTVSIRVSIEVPRSREISETQQLVETRRGRILETEYSECSLPADRRSGSHFRLVAYIFTILLLVKHLLAVVATGTEHYPFSLFTLLVLRASGILFPMYILVRVISAIQESIHHSHQESESNFDEEDEQQHDTVNILHS